MNDTPESTAFVPSSNGASTDGNGDQPISLHTGSEERDAAPVYADQKPRLPLSIVGMGASAGGLEAYTEFFEAMPPGKGIAFVLIQHLSPKRESLVAEILQKHTQMTVHQVSDGMLVEPDMVYVIRPGFTLTIKDGRFQLGESLLERGHSRPIDDFFRSLAEEQRERAIAVIFSGMGSNGTSGSQAIKVVGGMTIAQEPDSAKFPSMPRSVIDANLADYILKPGEMPEVLIRFTQSAYVERKQTPEAIAQMESLQINEILAILRTRTRNDFGGYKKPTIVRRIQRRMSMTQQADMNAYARMLRQTPSEVQNLSDDLLIHVSGFFRDPDVWHTLKEKVIKPLVAERPDHGGVRAWVTACASGEEAYTVAMLMVESAEAADKQLDIKVFATDMAERALTHARAGIYAGGIETEISPERLARFFDKEGGVYRIKRALREMVVFAPQNVLQDPPFSRLDLITCRNLLIYLEPEMQQRVLSLLHFGLREGGTLVLGNSETIADRDDNFEPIDKKFRIYRRVGKARQAVTDFPLPRVTSRLNREAMEAENPRLLSRASLTQITQKTLLERYTPAAVVVDRTGRIVYFHGETERFLDQPRGEPTRDVMALARDFVRGSVRVALHRAVEFGEPITVKDGTMLIGDVTHRIEVNAEPLERRGIGPYFLISFAHFPIPPTLPSAAGGEDATHMAGELQNVRDELQSTIEELQTSNEELKASNEEITSINEEMQSSNEELETSKEELQSLNEELTTVNSQLQVRMEELQNTSNDLASLLGSTEIGVIFLDRKLHIRRYTPAVKRLMDMIPSDVGRPLTDLARRFDDPQLLSDAQKVLQDLVPVETEVQADGGRWFSRRVLPYRTTEDRIDGVVITFVDVSDRRLAERKAEEAMTFADSIIETLHDPLLVLKPDLTVMRANAAFYARFKVKDQETIGRKIYDLGNRQWNIASLRKLLEDVLPQKKLVQNYEVEHDFESIGARTMLLNGRQVDHVQLILLEFRDTTDEKRISDALAAGEARFRAVTEVVPEMLWQMDPNGVPLWHNQRWTDYTGQTIEQSRNGGWLSVIHPEDRAETDASFKASLKSGKSWRREHRIRNHKTGEYRWFLVQGSPQRDDAGNILAWFGGVNDIHEQREALITARERHDQLQLLLQGAREFAILILSPENQIEGWNVGASQVFGYTEQEAMGQSGAIIFTPEDRSAGAHEAELSEAARTGQAADERQHLRKNGERFWGSGVMSAVKNADGTVRGFVKILRDVSQRREAERTLQLAKEDAETASRVKDEFLATLSHELRTPLSAVLIWTKLLRNAGPVSGNWGEGLESIERSAEAQKQLIDDMLDSQRIASGKLRLEMQTVSIGEVVRGAIDAIEPTAEVKNLAIETDIADVGEGRVDPDRLRQIVWNLLSNAVKFTRAGGTVTVKLSRRESGITLQVSDTGKGIDPAFLPHVFERFRQADPAMTRTTGGLGLGLSIVKQLVELHGGTIRAESEGPNHGATFTIDLPLSKVSRSRGKRSSQPSKGRAADMKGVSILVVEDQPATAAAIKSFFEGFGAKVAVAVNSPDALEQIARFKPAVLVSDIGLPGMDGIQLRQIRANEAESQSPRLPAVAMTAFVREEDRHATEQAGFDAFVGKPFDPQILLEAVYNALPR